MAAEYMPGACVRSITHEAAGVVRTAKEVRHDQWVYLVEWDVGSATWCKPDEIATGTLPVERKRSTDALDTDDYVLVIELIDALMALHDSGAIPVDLKPETRLGIKSLRAKIRAAL
jgi:hypothetical protein